MSRGLWLLVAGSVAMAPTTAAAQAKRPLTIDQFITTPIVGDPQPAPNGQLVAFTVSTPSLEDDRATSRIWMVEIASGETWQVTDGSGSERAPRWAPDGKSLTFLSTREGGSQLWRTAPRGGEPTRLSTVSDGVSDYLWSPEGKALYFWTDISWGDSTEAARRSAPYPTRARIWTDLFYRHWNEWRLGLRSHLFRLELESGSVTDVTPIDRDVPPLALGGRDIAVSPVGTEVALVYNPDSNLAISTNNDIFVMGPDGNSRQPVTTLSGNDNTPQYSPDGRYLAYLSMATPGFEADRQQLILYERATGRRIPLTGTWDQSIADYRWFPDARAILAEVEERGGHSLYRIEVPSGRRSRLVSGGTNSTAQVLPGGERLVFLRQFVHRAPEVYLAGADGRDPHSLTHVNDARFAELDLPPAESFGFVGGRGDSVFGWLVKPPGFNPMSRYPLIYLIHGGPQSAWLDQWHARWNYGMFAARGYVVAAVNFHGSTGYGQSFTNSISRNWGGLPYDDLMLGLDRVARLPWVDSTRMAAAGASYGGYMIYWMAGHTTRFRTLVAHDGIFNPLSMSGTTEELWFPLWEFGGSPLSPVARSIMEKWSPANYVQNWTTPMLIVHSQSDFRVDLSEGLQAFTALKLRKIPAKFLYFPDEDHFVVKPRNRRLWWGTVLDWLDQYLHRGR
jgi:dipeptidyl aminopeptidase/acylaminoacyl peptidase